jgi:carbon-monoxide dehydrogenase medium subunit
MKYAAPTSVDEARSLLADNPGSRVFAGATDLIPQMRSGRPAPSLIVDLKHIDQLMALAHDAGSWSVGAAAPTSTLTRDADFSTMFPGLSEAAGLIGSDQIQNRSSLGGNLCNASPAADSVPSMIANGLQAVIASGDGTRTAAVADVVTGPGQTSLADGEFIIEFTAADMPANTSDAYLRMIPRTEMDIAVVGAAVRLTVDGGVISDASVVLGAVAPTAVSVPDAEAALNGATVDGGTIDDATLATVAEAASAACNPIDDKRGTIVYRQQVAGVLAKRAANIAAQRAQNGA